MDEVGFPLVRIDPADLEAMASIFATRQEVADFYALSLELFEARLEEEPRLMAAWTKGQAIGRLTLRQAQLDAATGNKRGNAAMLIWLGKQSAVLAQEERPVAQTKNVNVSVKYVAEWGDRPGALGEEMEANAAALEDEEVVEARVGATLEDELEDAVLEDVEW